LADIRRERHIMDHPSDTHTIKAIDLQRQDIDAAA
jgi:hypothetical protein